MSFVAASGHLNPWLCATYRGTFVCVCERLFVTYLVYVDVDVGVIERLMEGRGDNDGDMEGIQEWSDSDGET